MTEQQAPYGKAKTIFRVEKNKDNPYVMIDKRPLENPTLSWKAKGMLAYLLSRPDNWTVRMGDLIKRSSDKSFAARSAVQELIAAGHIIRIYEREKGRISQVVLQVYEQPQPFRGNQQVEKPQVENRALNNTDSTNTDCNDIKETPNGESLKSPLIQSRKPDLVDFELSKLPMTSLANAIAQYWPFNVNWKTKTARQWLQWAHEKEVTPEQLRFAAERWRSDKRFNWRQPTLMALFENWPALMEPGQLNHSGAHPL